AAGIDDLQTARRPACQCILKSEFDTRAPHEVAAAITPRLPLLKLVSRNLAYITSYVRYRVAPVVIAGLTFGCADGTVIAQLRFAGNVGVVIDLAHIKHR